MALPLMSRPKTYRVRTIVDSGAAGINRYLVGPLITGEPGESLEALAARAEAQGLATNGADWLDETGRWRIL